MNISEPFLSADAQAPPRGTLAGPRYRPVFRGTHVAAATDDSLVVRARAAALLADGAVVGGHAAAAVLGAQCAPRDALVELVVGRHRLRPRPGLRIRQDVLRPDEWVEVDGLRVTSPIRTAHDLVRTSTFVEGVVALDALARTGRFDPAELLGHRAGERPRGLRRVAPAVAAADRRSMSPPETRLRLALVANGVPCPVPQHPVAEVRARWTPHVDLAWPEVKVAVEYQGDQHRTDPTQWRRDQERWALLAAAGWLVLPATWEDLYCRPVAFAARVAAAIASRV